jgi:eukaryotic-like serine/threonine-protein kinase
MPHEPPGDPGPPTVPGYRLEALLGRGGSGEVWRAVPRGGGPPVAVKLLASGDPERQAREAALLGALDHPHLVRLREVVHQPRQGTVPRVALVLDLLEGGSLAELLARRGRLRPGEVVTALAPVAAALAVAHEHGVVHGDLSPGNVVFTAEGRPVLTDLGVARVLGEAAAGGVTPADVDPTVARGGAPGPASDVFGVAAAAFHALTGVPPWNAADPAGALAVAAAGELPDLAELAPGAPPELVAVVRRGLSAEPAERGSAAAFALDLRHACRPEPVRLPAPGMDPGELARTGAGPATELTHPRRRLEAEPPAHRAPTPARRRRWPSRRLLTGGAAAALVTLAAGVWAGTDRAPAASPAAPAAASPLPSAAPAATDRAQVPADAAGWREVVAELYRRRATAFATASAAPLAGVYADGSPLLAADRRAVEQLAARGQVLRGFTPMVRTVTALAATPGRAELRLVDSRPASDVVAAGTVVDHTAARAAAPVRMVLVATPAGWRIDTAELLP